MSDLEMIHRTLAEYCQFLDDRRFDDWVHLFAEDAVFAIGSGSGPKTVIAGRAAILDDILDGELAHKPELRRKHAFLNPIIDVNGDAAGVIIDVLVFDQHPDEPFGIRLGKCTMELVKHEGRWLISRREYGQPPC